MSFQSRDEFIKAQSSNKLTLVHIESRNRLINWEFVNGSTYRKSVAYVTVGLKQDQTDLSYTSNLSLNEGQFRYDPTQGYVYAHFNGSIDPSTANIAATYRHFFSTMSLTAPWDLPNNTKHSFYEGRLISSPGYNYKVGIDQALTSIVGSGQIVLQNGDGGLDQLFDKVYFENRDVTVFSWNKDLAFSDAKIIYRGKITNKSFNNNRVTFKVKDGIFNLEQALPLETFSESDNVTSSVVGKYKRWLYGRVDGLKLQSLDQVGDGYNISGTVAGISTTNQLVGTGTSFLSELSPNDEITIGSQTFQIESVEDDNNATLDNEIDFTFSGATAFIKPEISPPTKNRTFLVAGHACARIETNIVKLIQLNRIQVDSTEGLFTGDLIEFETGERKQIKNIAPDNIIVLTDNYVTNVQVGQLVTRQPVQRLYKGSELINASDFTIDNQGAPNNYCQVTLPTDLEFNLARNKSLSKLLQFTNGSRVITTTEDIDLREYVNSRDYIRPADVSYTTFYEILSVEEQQITLRQVFSEPTILNAITFRNVDYINDTTNISAEVLGRTDDGEPNGVWLKTASDVVKDCLLQIGVPNSLINTSSFDIAEIEAPQTISLKIPTTVTGRKIEAKTVVDLMNKTVLGALTLDNDLKYMYKILQNNIPESPIIIRDEDVIDWKITTTNGKTFRDSTGFYRQTDIDRNTLEAGQSQVDFTSEFIRDYIETSKKNESDFYLFNESEAAILNERLVYINRLSRSDIDVETDLRLENLQIGDIVQLEFKRLYSRLGDSNSKKKICMVVEKRVNGEKIDLGLTDLGNTFNTSSVIAPNTTNDYANATEDEKLKYGFITDGEGIVNNEDETANINLIS